MSALSMSVKDVVAATSLSEQVIREAVATRALPARKVGTRVVILTADVEQWLRSLPMVGGEGDS